MYYLILSVENAVSQNGKPYQILNLVAPSLFTILPTDQGSTPQDSDQGSNQPGSTLSGSTPQSFQYLSFPDFVQPLVSFKAYLWNSTVPSDAVSKFVFVPSTYFSNSKGFINLTLSSSPQFYPLDHFVSRSGYSQLQQFYFTYFKPIPSYQEFFSLIQGIQSQDSSDSLLIVRLKLFINQQIKSLHELYSLYPAAHSYHHAFQGGLLVHVTEMLRLLNSITPSFQKVTPFSPTMVLLGVLYHDFGKTLEYNPQGEYQEPLYLQGHVYLSSHYLQNALIEFFKSYPDTISQESVTKFINRCVHLPLSHHALAQHLDWGSPVQPHSAEAFLLTHLDALSGHGDQFNRSQNFTLSQCTD